MFSIGGVAHGDEHAIDLLFLGCLELPGSTQHEITTNAVTIAIEQSTRLAWGIETGRSTRLAWGIETGRSTRLSWSSKVEQGTRLAWGISQTVEQSTRLAWDLTTAVEQATRLAWSILDYNQAEQSTRLSWSIDAALPTLKVNVDTSIVIDATQRRIAHDNLRINRDIDSWAQSFSADVLDVSDWQALAGTPDVTIMIGGASWKMRVEGRNQSLPFGDHTISIAGRSRTAVLARGYASQIDQTWTNTTAKTIVQSLCDAAGVTLDWQIIDWPLTEYSANGRYPIDIISEIVGSVECVLYTADDSTLQVLLPYKRAPSKYADEPADVFINSNDDQLSSLHQYIKRDDYDHIEVGNESAGTESQLSVSLRSEANDSGITVRIYVVPFKKLTLNHSAPGHLSLIYRGIKTEQITETIEIVDGKGSLSNPFYGLHGIDWRYANLGSVSILEDGSVTASTDGQSLVDITYTTKWIEYDASSSGELVQVYIEDEP